ncbi:Component of the SF3b subcomplex of the U2 snRNP [Zalaria obscura]|uniref:Component of the SF3b subcomplex of the U2 snRNP n=1 Tax=Zalaria obscura TaxID=2024903 RepID=A0ACC3SGR8_9PEZI
MPPLRTARNRKPPPEGFDDIEDTLLEFANKMKDAENASHEGKKKHEMVWPVFQITHQRSRYIYDLYYEKEAISRQLYDWLLKNGYADANLIAKWKKQGYEKLCCLRCIQTKETNFNSTCICRVPKDQLKEDQGQYQGQSATDEPEYDTSGAMGNMAFQVLGEGLFTYFAVDWECKTAEQGWGN